MKTTPVLTTLVLSLTLLLGACESDDDGAAPVNETNELDTNEETATQTRSFDGTWFQACTLDEPTDPSEGYRVQTITIDGSSSTQRTFYYQDAACAQPAVPPETTEIVLEVSIVYPGGSVSTPRGEASFVDVSLDSVSRNGQAATAEEFAQITADGDVRYELLLIENDMLYFGDVADEEGPGDARSPETRPQTLETLGYIRQ